MTTHAHMWTELLELFAILGVAAIGLIAFLIIIEGFVIRHILLPLLLLICAGTAACIGLILFMGA